MIYTFTCFLLEASCFTSGVAAPHTAAKGKTVALLGAYSSLLLSFFAFYF
jgi:hypothetical protein